MTIIALEASSSGKNEQCQTILAFEKFREKKREMSFCLVVTTTDCRDSADGFLLDASVLEPTSRPASSQLLVFFFQADDQQPLINDNNYYWQIRHHAAASLLKLIVTRLC